MGRCAVARTGGRLLLLSDLLYRVRLRDGDPNFVSSCAAAPQVRLQLQNSVRTDAGQTLKIRSDDLRDLVMPAVPAHAQPAAVRDLRTEQHQADQVEQKLHRQIELLQERRQALITAAVTGQLPVAA